MSPYMLLECEKCSLFLDSEAQIYSVCETKDLEDSIIEIKQKIEKHQS